jgi:hypothetical protein
MTSHGLAKILKIISDLLLSLPDQRIDKSLLEVLEAAGKHLLTEQKTQKETKKIAAKEEAVNSLNDKSLSQQDFVLKLHEMSLEEASNFIESNPQLRTISALNELAKTLNLGISGRQKRETIVHTILKHLERSRLDETIRSRSKREEATEKVQIGRTSTKEISQE